MAAAALLALAKDVRYVEEAAVLMVEVNNAILGEASSIGGEHQREFWTAAGWALYLCVVVGRRGKPTLGMEAAGLEFKDAGGLKSLSWSVVVISALYWTTARKANAMMSREGLRGLNRREAYEQQRQAMIRRSNNGRIIHQQQQQNDSDSSPTSSPPSEDGMERSRTTLASLSSLLGWNVFGPHDLPENFSDNLLLGPRNIGGLVKWLLKLHLGLFCYQSSTLEGGKQPEQPTPVYPTLWHRLLRLDILSQTKSKRLVNHPSTKVVGLLLLLQSAGVGINTVSQLLARRWIEWRHARRPSSLTASPIHFEGHYPTAPKESRANAVPCGICQQPRVHPACSTKCGHVLCWTCWQGWLLEHGSSCPICRVDCTPADILSLQNYHPQ